MTRLYLLISLVDRLLNLDLFPWLKMRRFKMTSGRNRSPANDGQHKATLTLESDKNGALSSHINLVHMWEREMQVYFLEWLILRAVQIQHQSKVIQYAHEYICYLPLSLSLSLCNYTDKFKAVVLTFCDVMLSVYWSTSLELKRSPWMRCYVCKTTCDMSWFY